MNSSQTRPDNPTTVAERLRANPKLLDESANADSLSRDASSVSTTYLVRLDMLDGYFQLHWSASTVGEYDWVGLYVNDSLLEKDYIAGNNWQWAVKAPPYKTSTPAQIGYQARYLVWDGRARNWKAVARSDSWSAE